MDCQAVTLGLDGTSPVYLLARHALTQLLGLRDPGETIVITYNFIICSYADYCIQAGID